MSFKSLSALLTLGLASLIAAPLAAHAQTAQVSQKPVLTTLHSFDGPYGMSPRSALLQVPNGDFYGETYYGGLDAKPDTASGFGTVFKITPQGQFTTLFKFTGKDGSHPVGGLNLASNGILYGATESGGANGTGTVFAILPDDEVTTLFTFPALVNGTNSIGASPTGPPFPASNGALYGLCAAGGQAGKGTLYDLAKNGVLNSALSFNDYGGDVPVGSIVGSHDNRLVFVVSQAGGIGFGALYSFYPGQPGFFGSLAGDFVPKSVGAPLNGSLCFDKNDNIYATTYGGGIYDGPGFDPGAGQLVFIAATSSSYGQYTVLHGFSGDGHGTHPLAGVVGGTDGQFYGTTFGAFRDNGTVYRFPASGKVTSLYKFHIAPDQSFPHGALPSGGVIFGKDGALYGTTETGGKYSSSGHSGYGTIFKLTLP